MAEIEITLPTVQYGNVKVRATPEELGLESISDATALGIGAAIYLNLFAQGFKTGSQMDVKTPSGAEQAASVPEAQAMLDEGLGGVSEVEEHEDNTESAAPWDAPAPPAKRPKKPWEVDGVTSPAALDALGDGW